MATKPKSSEGQAAVKDVPLETLLAKALEPFTAGKLKEAQTAFEALREEAARTDTIRMVRVATDYLRAISERLEADTASAPVPVEMAAQLELNRHAYDAALAQAEAGLKANPEHAGLHYLKAVALAQMDQPQPAADALAQATTLDPALIYQYRLEPDFDGVRHSAPFAAFNRG